MSASALAGDVIQFAQCACSACVSSSAHVVFHQEMMLHPSSENPELARQQRQQPGDVSPVDDDGGRARDDDSMSASGGDQARWLAQVEIRTHTTQLRYDMRTRDAC
jgi:hypothetical protein